MTEEQTSETTKGKCPHDPRQYLGAPIGMYHCPECGEMVLAGMEHPDYSLLAEELQQAEEEEYFARKETNDES